MNTVSKKLIKPTAAGIQEMARGYFSVDVRNGSVSMTEAELTPTYYADILPMKRVTVVC